VDLNFSFAVDGVDWSFGVLEVLNRRAAHALATLSPSRELWEGHVEHTRGSTNPEALRLHRRFVNAAVVAVRARAKLEREARFSAQRSADLIALGEAAEMAQLLPLVDIDASLFDPAVGMTSAGYSLQWTAAGRAEAAETARRFAQMAARPLFEALPLIPLPAKMRVLPDDRLSRDAVLVTAAALVDLPPWGFAPPAAGGGEDGDAAEIRVRLARPAAARARARGAGRAGGEDGEGVEGRLACPTDVWDEAPSDMWHPLAREMARDI
jgi:hypothetical protein